MEIKEIIIVEGRDDTRAVLSAVEGVTIETHGFGITRETWEKIEAAEKRQGIIIFTDPDYMGEKIRKRISERFPNAKHAHIHRGDGTKKGNIGIENANKEVIIHSLEKAKAEGIFRKETFSMEDLRKAQLIGDEKSVKRRRDVGKILGIGYGNGKAFLKKLNKYAIEKEEFHEAVHKTNLK